MRLRVAMLFILLTASVPVGATAFTDDPTIQQLLDRAGIKPNGDRRGQMDTVGFVFSADQMDEVLAQCDRLAIPQQKVLENRHGWGKTTAFIAGVCPHDDYYYAGRLYSLLVPHFRAKRVILFGVFHKARIFNCRDLIVFDSYKTWNGPYGPVNVSSLREEITGRLPADDFLINNDMQMVEHSVEAIVPFLQAYNREVEIVPILVPYMDWNTMDRLAANLSQALTSIVREKGWRLGDDLCLVSSADAVHYGDADWGGSNFAEFGTDVAGYQKAVRRDLDLSQNLLCGPLDREKLKEFLFRCVDAEDITRYKITWCGRFSVPFGLNVASRLVEALEGRPLEGILLDYGTSISEVSLEVEGLNGLGPTAPNNLHHFVGYPAIGYQ